MKNKSIILGITIAGLSMFFSGCSVFPLAQTEAEKQSGFTYVPIDPFSVETVGTTKLPGGGAECLTNMLQSLPDNAVRIAVEQYDASGNITYGPAGFSSKGSKYKITVDYINADTSNIKLWIFRSIEVQTNGGVIARHEARYRSRTYVNLTEPLPPRYVPGSVSYTVLRASTNAVDNYTNLVAKLPDYGNKTNAIGTEVNIPVYIGIGLRVTAEISSVQGGINISGLGAIGVAADAKRLSGSLVVQTLGVNGKSISAALPIQSELNQTTAQNAIVAVGAIKALLYERDTVIVPRVVGIYLPYAGGKPLVNAIISELSKERVPWTPMGKKYVD